MTQKSPPTAQTTTIQNPRLRLLNKLRTSDYPVMTFMALPSVRMAQVVALTGVDGIIIDCEHGHISDDAMHNSVAAISALGVSPIIRVRGPAHDILKRALDTGTHGIMVPQINTAEEARQVVASSKFPPYGVRGQGSAFPAIGHGLTTPELDKVVLKRAVLDAATSGALVADSTKYGTAERFRVVPLDALDVIVSDAELPESAAAAIAEMGVELWTAGD